MAYPVWIGRFLAIFNKTQVISILFSKKFKIVAFAPKNYLFNIRALTQRSVMLIFRKSVLTGKTNQMHISIHLYSSKQYNKYLNDPNANMNKYFPKLSPEQREFLMSGITPDEFEASLCH